MTRTPHYTVDEIGKFVAGGNNEDLMDYLFRRKLTSEEYDSLWIEAVQEIIRQWWWFRTIIDKGLMEDILYWEDPEHGLSFWLQFLKWHHGHAVRIKPIDTSLEFETQLETGLWDTYLHAACKAYIEEGSFTAA